MATLNDVESLLAKAQIAGPADEKQIQEAETALGVGFPADYRSFLSRFGAIFCPEVEIAGLFHSVDDNEPPLWSNVVSNTLRIRRVLRGEFPIEYVFISDDGGDYKFYLDTSRRDANGECPVIALGPGADAVAVAENFFAFVERVFEQTLSFQPPA
jgi:hypothetical protein